MQLDYPEVGDIIGFPRSSLLYVVTSINKNKSITAFRERAVNNTAPVPSYDLDPIYLPPKRYLIKVKSKYSQDHINKLLELIK
jgi:hypothetical protein